MSRIPETEIERIKRDVDLVALIQSKGIECRKHGSKDLAARCPFHQEDTASLIITPHKNIWHCMGCGKGGSVFDFVMAYEGMSFRHAYEVLAQGDVKNLMRAGPPVKHSFAPKLESPVAFDADDYTVMAQVIDYYHQRLKQTPLALEYLQKRGITKEAIAMFQIGYADRTLGLRLPNAATKADGEMRERLKKLGLLRAETGHEHFNGCVTFPITSAVGITEVYGRKVYNNLRPGTHYHLYLPGDRAADRDAVRFLAKGIECYRMKFPHNMDANEYARKVTPPDKSLGLLIRSAEWLGKGKAPETHTVEPPAEKQPWGKVPVEVAVSLAKELGQELKGVAMDVDEDSGEHLPCVSNVSLQTGQGWTQEPYWPAPFKEVEAQQEQLRQMAELVLARFKMVVGFCFQVRRLPSP